ncbi:H-NS family nucleoid-associated regulatory protein [Burkholderia territorii]|uniref:H-NS histone family protein n=1 Tax=Burkholderia territorii TaxID=1503055 RepID=UPI00075929B0|nr:H-NS histone family protein [Burkholderia territorii]KVQ61198.1 H-NS histone [Burkholderia territorii]
MKSYRELLEQLEQLRREIDIVREFEARRIAQRVLELLAENGVKLDELTGQALSGRRPVKRPAPKYYNPETGATWSGRGRKPLWLAGDDIERFLIREHIKSDDD